MKRILVWTLIVCLCLSFCACGGTQNDPEATETQPPSTNAPTTVKSLKVLAIGNSFSVDAMQHLYAVSKAEGVTEIVLGNLYIPGCPLSKHAANIKTGEAAYKYYKNTTGDWVVSPMAYTLLQGIQDEEWDIITMQQSSGNSGLVETFEPHLSEMITFVNENKKNPDAKLFWHMTWAYQADSDHGDFADYGNDQNSMYLGIVNALQKSVEPLNAFEKVMPVGTAIQNARTSFVGDTLTRDGFHLSDLGRVIASYTWYTVINGQPLYAVNIDRAGAFTITDSHKKVIVEAVNAAIANPYGITRSEIKVP